MSARNSIPHRWFKTSLIGLWLLTFLSVTRATELDSPAAAQTNSTANVVTTNELRGIPVRLDGEVVLRVKSAMGPFTAEERAAIAGKRLLRIANDPFYSPELFRVEVVDQGAHIYYRNEMVGATTPEDAQAAGLSPEAEVARVVSLVQAAVERYRDRRMPSRLAVAGISLVAATVVAGLLLFGLRRLSTKIETGIEQDRKSIWIERLKQRLGIRPERSKRYLLKLVRLLRAGLVVVIVFGWLEATFTVVPMTRGYALAVLHYLINPLSTLWHGFLHHIGDLFFILVVVWLTHYLLKFLRWVAVEVRIGVVRLPGIAPEFAVPLYKIVRLAVIAFAAVIIYPYIPGSSTAAFKGISLFAGAVFTLGASGTAGNFIGGVVLVFMGHYRLGDRIRLGDVVGDVIEVNLLVTRIRTPKNEVVSLPNASIMGGQLVNYSTRAKQEGLILHTTVTIGYDAPWRQVHELLLAAARRTKELLETPEPFVLQTALDDFYVAYQLNAYTRSPNEMPAIYSALHQNIQDEFNRAGVQIMSPHYLGDPAKPKIVPPGRWSETTTPNEGKAKD